MFQPALGHELHADADAEERAPGVGRLHDRLFHARHGGEPAGAIGERPLAGQHDAVGARHQVRIGGHGDGGRQPRPLRRQGQRAGGGGEVAAAVIDHRDFHDSAPAGKPGRNAAPSSGRCASNRSSAASASGAATTWASV